MILTVKPRRWPGLAPSRFWGLASLLAVALAAALLDSALVAQSREDRVSREDFTLRETIDVRLIHLDAVVTSRSNEPLTDLGASDFDLRVEGKKVKVTAVTSGRELRESIAGRLTLVVFIDERHLLRAHRDGALEDIEEALVEEMDHHPTWVAVTSYSDRLEPLLAPTRDVAAVRETLEAVRSSESVPSEILALQRTTSNEVRDVLRQLAKSGSTYRYGQAALGSVVNRARAYGEALAHQTRQTLDGLELLVEALSFVPGRKAVLLLTDGLPREPLDRVAKTMSDRLAGGSVVFGGDDLAGDRETPLDGINSTTSRPTGSDRGDASGQTVEQTDDGGAGQFQTLVADFSCEPQFEHLAALANTHRVTFYPIKPPILDTTRSGLGERRGERGSITELSDMTSGLDSLAFETGGLAFSGDHGVTDFLRTARTDVSTYYSLSFTPPDSLGGSAIRQIELKVRRKRTRIRHRASYVPLSMEQSLASRTWGTLLFDWEENLHGLEIDISQEAIAADVRPVEILISLPIGRLELVPNGRVVAGNFRAVIQLRDHYGGRLTPQNLGFVVQVPAESLEAATHQFFALRARFELPLGVYDLGVGLWEENTGKTSFVTRPLAIGERGPPVAAL